MNDRRCLALLIAIQLVVVAVVAPRGNFPLNDDWAYAHSVQWLLAEHRIRLSDWIAMNLLPQTLAGGLATAAFGFSFETLRHITQCVAVLASVAAFYWFRAARLEPSQALVASLALIAAPFWPALANSYMTDLYGLVFALPAATLFLRALERPSRGALIAATILASIGVLQRQVVIVVPFAFMVAWFWARRPWTRRSIAIGIAPFTAAVAAEAGYHLYLALGPGVPLAQEYAHGRVLPLLAKALTNEDLLGEWVISNVLTMTGYLGLLLAGWAGWWGMRGASRTLRAGVLCATVAIAAVTLTLDTLPPYRPNQVVDAAGIGPFTLYDGLPRGIVPLDRSPGVVWRVAGVAAAFGTAALLAMLFATGAHLVRSGRNGAERVFMVALLVAYLGPFAVTDYGDRYLVFALPFLMALWAGTWPAASGDLPPPRLQRAIALAWIVALLGFSAAATRDYFSWNRARWNAIRTAERLGASADSLDGGFEYNGLRRYEVKPRTPVPGKSWWWVKDDRYVVAFSPLPGYEEIETWRVEHWLSRSPSEVKLLRRR
jgi:Dolichyl-phosphate-mannose-protein mannosyltransferase